MQNAISYLKSEEGAKNCSESNICLVGRSGSDQWNSWPLLLISPWVLWKPVIISNGALEAFQLKKKKKAEIFEDLVHTLEIYTNGLELFVSVDLNDICIPLFL